jgi:signal peptide peptidase SppA
MRTEAAGRPAGGAVAALTGWFRPRRPVVAVVPIHGALIAGGRIGRAFDDEHMAPVLERAFSLRGASAVALAINCPGGSATQSAMIAARIRRLSAEKKVPVVAFCADVAASGGYWLACAADEIYADASSIVGSIGVIAASFGLHDAIARLGIERRVHTAGEMKSFWDPFRPEKEQDVARLRRLQDRIHHQFVEWVKARRGHRLTDSSELFNGEFWVGEEALGLGLIDGIGHLVPTMRARFGKKVRFRAFTRRRRWAERLGLPGADAVADEIAARALYARFGI